MTYATIYQAVADLRFNSSAAKIAQIKQWVGKAEIELWNSDAWVFKRVPAASLSVTSGSRTPAMPADFGKATRLFDNQGGALTYLDPELWEERYIPDSSTGTPCEYTVINRQVYLGPTPSASVTFKLSYRRRYAHYNVSAAITAGVMSVDSDYPLWDAEFHYILVPWAQCVGATLEGDPWAADIAGPRDEMLEAMRAELVQGEADELVQWGDPSGGLGVDASWGTW